VASAKRPKRMSPEGREAVSKAAKKRWREWRKANGKAKPKARK
jgi:hypothetical protein